MKESRTKKIQRIKAEYNRHSAAAELAFVSASLAANFGKDEQRADLAAERANRHLAEKWKIYWRVKKFCPGLAWVFE